GHVRCKSPCLPRAKRHRPPHSITSSARQIARKCASDHRTRRAGVPIFKLKLASIGVPKNPLGAVSGVAVIPPFDGDPQISKNALRVGAIRRSSSDRIMTMKADEIELEPVLDFTVSDDDLEYAAADKIFSLGNCTEARVCQAPNEPG